MSQATQEWGDASAPIPQQMTFQHPRIPPSSKLFFFDKRLYLSSL
jgi:hypothetical protein